MIERNEEAGFARMPKRHAQQPLGENIRTQQYIRDSNDSFSLFNFLFCLLEKGSVCT
jgi:hypothetical protein